MSPDASFSRMPDMSCQFHDWLTLNQSGGNFVFRDKLRGKRRTVVRLVNHQAQEWSENLLYPNVLH
jgi:hypothetical protein